MHLDALLIIIQKMDVDYKILKYVCQDNKEGRVSEKCGCYMKFMANLIM